MRERELEILFALIKKLGNQLYVYNLHTLYYIHRKASMSRKLNNLHETYIYTNKCRTN